MLKFLHSLTRLKTYRFRACGTAVILPLLSIIASAADPAPVATTPPFPQPNIQPTLPDFVTARPVAEKLQILKADPLLRPPFAEQPVDSPKGLAAKIRAEELDVKNRVKAVNYLGTVDCRAYPEAQATLIDAMHNDKYEAVRYEAAKSLRNMMTHGACGKHGKPAKMHVHAFICKHVLCHHHIPKKRLPTGYDNCPGCCTRDALDALAKTAYDCNELGCPFEPSQRVREMAKEALELCCQNCPNCKQYVPAYSPGTQPIEPITPVPGEELPPVPVEELPPAAREIPPAPPAPAVPGVPGVPPANPPRLPMLFPPSGSGKAAEVETEREVTLQTSVETPPCSGLNGFCVVALSHRKLLHASPTFQSNVQGRSYWFSSAAAKAEFDRSPETFALAFDGIDPVYYLQTGEKVEGLQLREFDGHRYAFINEANWNAFRSNPQQYVQQFQHSNVLTVQQ